MLIVLAILYVNYHICHQERVYEFKVPKDIPVFAKLKVITLAPSKIHYKSENCEIKFHDINGNPITELPGNFSGEIEMMIVCHSDDNFKIWLDNGVIWFDE